VLVDGTRTDGSAAIVVLDPVAVTMLRAWRTAQVAERRWWPGPKQRTNLVSTRQDGAPLKPDWPNRRFAREAGLPAGVRAYDLRHGWATAALTAGVHPKLVQEVMRHGSDATTADTYSHLMPSHSAEAVARVASLFRQPPTSLEAPEQTAATGLRQ